LNTTPSAPGRGRLAAIGVAAALVVAGLLLAVGAGARSGKSVRDASYPVTYAFKMKVSSHVGKAKAGGHVKLKFHPVYTSTGQKPPHAVTKSLKYKCKLDKKHKQKCDSPQQYGGLSGGKHKFTVQAFYFYGTLGSAASAPKKVKFKVG